MSEIHIKQITKPTTSPNDLNQITTLINKVYNAAEGEIWTSARQRITPTETSDLIDRGQIYCAYTTISTKLIGSVRFQTLSPTRGEFGMLAVDPSAQRSGVGRRMVDFVEDLASGMGMDVMELGVVVPVQGVLESKVFLMEWYRRLGYREVKRVSFDESLPRRCGRCWLWNVSMLFLRRSWLDRYFIYSYAIQSKKQLSSYFGSPGYGYISCTVVRNIGDLV